MTLAPADPALRAHLGLEKAEGRIATAIDPGCPAAAAGTQQNAVLVRLGEGGAQSVPVAPPDDLEKGLKATGPRRRSEPAGNGRMPRIVQESPARGRRIQRNHVEAGLVQPAENDRPVPDEAMLVHRVTAQDRLAVLATHDPDAPGCPVEGTPDRVDARGPDEEAARCGSPEFRVALVSGIIGIHRDRSPVLVRGFEAMR